MAPKQAPGERDDEPRDLVAEVEADTTRLLGTTLAVRTDGDGYRRVDSFGDDGVVVGEAGGREFTFVRWQFQGSQDSDVPKPDIDRLFIRGTGNPVVVDGLTVLEDRDGDIFARRFVDWLGVYAQLGLVFAGRPVGTAGAQWVSPLLLAGRDEAGDDVGDTGQRAPEESS